MPDHLHLLVEGCDPGSDFRKFMSVMRRRLSDEYHRSNSGILWQDGYFERVLRDEEGTQAVVAYILGNPIRAGLVENATDYPFSWSIII